MFFRIALIVTAGILAACSSPKTSHTPKAGFSGDWAEFERLAKRNRTRVALPPFETTPQASLDAVNAAIAAADERLDVIGRIKPSEATFDNTIGALDDLAFDLSLVANRTYMLKETSENAEHRAQATEAIKQFDEWAVGLDYREDVYSVVKAYADSSPRLSGEAKRSARADAARLSPGRPAPGQGRARRGRAAPQATLRRDHRVSHQHHQREEGAEIHPSATRGVA